MFHINESNPNKYFKNIVNSEFIASFKMKWDDLHEDTAVFRYRIDVVNEKIMDNYLLQLNPNRGIKRRTPEHIDSIVQPFDDDKFNFTKVDNKEILCILTKHNSESDKHAVLVNVSPIHRYHSLLCPSIDKRLPQVVTQDSLQMVLDFMMLVGDRGLKVGFNSLCAFASVNHLHYHIFLEPRTLPVELAKCKHLNGSLYCIQDYIVPAFYIDVTKQNSTASEDIFKLVQCLIQKSIAHNIFMTSGSNVERPDEDAIRVFIWPRKMCSGVKSFTAFNVAVCELAGWFPIYDADSYLNIKVEVLEKELNKWKYEEFDELCSELKSLF